MAVDIAVEAKMNGEQKDQAGNPGILAYATPDQLAGWKPPPAWLNRVAIVLSLFLLTVFVLGLPPLAGAVDYTRDIPLSEVIEYGWETGIRGTLRSPYMVFTAMFAPMAVAGLLSFLCLRGTWPHRIALVANIVLPVFWLGPLWPTMAAIGPGVLLSALAGGSDGETWSEGFVCYGAMACWTTLWVAVAVVLFFMWLRRLVKSSH